MDELLVYIRTKDSWYLFTIWSRKPPIAKILRKCVCNQQHFRSYVLKVNMLWKFQVHTRCFSYNRLVIHQALFETNLSIVRELHTRSGGSYDDPLNKIYHVCIKPLLHIFTEHEIDWLTETDFQFKYCDFHLRRISNLMGCLYDFT